MIVVTYQRFSNELSQELKTLMLFVLWNGRALLSVYLYK